MDSRRRRPLRFTQWLQIVLAGFIGAAAGFAIASAQSATYQAKMSFFVSAASDTDAAANAQAGSIAQQLVKSYPNLVNSGQVTSAVSSRVPDLKLSATDLQNDVSAAVPLDTAVLNVTVTSSTAADAKRVADGYADVLPGFLQRLQGANTPSSPIVVTLTQPPTLPDSAASPNKQLDLVLGALVGLAVGLAWVLLRAARDEKVRSVDEAAAAAGVPALVEIPRGRVGGSTVLVGASAVTAQGEAYRHLRTSVQVKPGDHRCIVVASARPAEGRTSTAANLAVALATAGRQVILIDGDLRRPSLSDEFGYSRAPGLADVLLGQVRLEDGLRRWRDDIALSVLPAGSSTSGASELLSSPALTEVLRSCRERADVVIVDTPPLLAVTDAAVIAAVADSAILVVHQGETDADEVARSAARLREVGANLRGVVVNNPRRGLRRSKPRMGTPTPQPESRKLTSQAVSAGR